MRLSPHDRRFLDLAAALGLAVLVRVPFWIEALKTPLDGDEAIIGLMARHPFSSATIWGQPFGSPLEALLISPFVAGFGGTLAAFRIPYFLLGLLLVPLAYALGGRLHPRAALPAALLAACPPPYLLLLGSAATIYPAALVLCGVLLLTTFRLADRLASGSTAWLGLSLWGALAGLAVWTHMMAASVTLACGLYLGRRMPRRAMLLLPLCAALVVSSPWWSRGVGTALSIARPSTAARPAVSHLARGAANLAQASSGLLGARTPLIVDDGRSMLGAPGWQAAALSLAFGLPLAWTLARRRASSDSVLLLATIAFVLAAFPLPARSGPNTLRYLTPAFLPLMAIVAGAMAALPRRALVVALTGVLALDLAGRSRLLAALQGADRAEAPFGLPDLRPVLEALEAHGIDRAYASYGPAYRLTWESQERVIGSQPWNERFRQHPLPLVDEVRFAKRVAWVLTPGIPSDLPDPAAFEANLREIGAGWKRLEAGAAVVYYDFSPPVGAIARPLATAAAAGDGDVATRLEPEPGRPLQFRVPGAAPLTGVTLLAGSDGPRLPRSMDVEVSADCARFEVVLRRRSLEEREHLAWINGQPRYAVENDALTIPLFRRPVACVRIRPSDPSERWALAELLVHPEAGPDGAPEWLAPDLSWPERRESLRGSPMPDRADWYYRSMLSERAVADPRS